MSLGCFEMLLLRSVSMFGSVAVDELAVDPVVAGHAVGSDGGAISVVVGAVAVDIDRGCGVVVDHSAVGVNAGSVHDDVVGLILVVYGTGRFPLSPHWGVLKWIGGFFGGEIIFRMCMIISCPTFCMCGDLPFVALRIVFAV